MLSKIKAFNYELRDKTRNNLFLKICFLKVSDK